MVWAFKNPAEIRDSAGRKWTVKLDKVQLRWTLSICREHESRFCRENWPFCNSLLHFLPCRRSPDMHKWLGPSRIPRKFAIPLAENGQLNWTKSSLASGLQVIS